jgi:hypothetical protein
VKPTKKTNVDFRPQSPNPNLPASFRPAESFGHPLCVIFAEEEMGGPNDMGQPHAIPNCHKKE